jgi:hypothetical protein
MKARSPLRLIQLGSVGLGLGAAALLALRELPYSSSAIDVVQLGGSADSVGILEWDPAVYTRAPSLASYRDLVHEQCDGLGPVATAKCLHGALIESIPVGVPAAEFVDREYDPSAALAAHIAGAPGHCMTYSALLATSLLAAGFPARVVQILPRDGRGHTAVEVRDRTGRWLLVDPTFGGALRQVDGSAAPATLVGSGTFVWAPLGESARVDPGGLPDFYSHRQDAGGHIVYPEPWLYTRVGKRTGAWPYRGRFVVVGPPEWHLGVGHMVLAGAITLAGIWVAAFVALACVARLRVRRGDQCPRARGQEEVALAEVRSQR